MTHDGRPARLPLIDVSRNQNQQDQQDQQNCQSCQSCHDAHCES